MPEEHLFKPELSPWASEMLGKIIELANSPELKHKFFGKDDDDLVIIPRELDGVDYSGRHGDDIHVQICPPVEDLMADIPRGDPHYLETLRIRQEEWFLAHYIFDAPQAVEMKGPVWTKNVLMPFFDALASVGVKTHFQMRMEYPSVYEFPIEEDDEEDDS